MISFCMVAGALSSEKVADHCLFLVILNSARSMEGLCDK